MVNILVTFVRKIYNLYFILFISKKLKWVNELEGENVQLIIDQEGAPRCKFYSDEVKLDILPPPNGITEKECDLPRLPIVKRNYLYKLRNVRLSGMFPIVHFEGFIINDTVHHLNTKNQSRIKYQLFSNMISRIKSFIPRQVNKTSDLKRIDVACIMLSKWNHYGHWMPEQLLMLKKIHDSNLKNVKLVIESNAPEWKINILSDFGWSRDSIVFWDGKSLNVNELLVPSYPQYNYSDFSWIKGKLTRNCDNLVAYDYIYLSREKIGTRYVENQSELNTILTKFDIHTIYPEEHSIQEQIEIFSKAKIIISPHGSALTNLMFASDATVIEFYGYKNRSAFYRMSVVMGLSYHALACNSQGSHYSTMNVDCIKLQSLLSELIS